MRLLIRWLVCLALLPLALLTAACSSSAPPAPRYPVYGGPPPPAPPPAPAGASVLLDALGALQQAMPCPPPGLPPQLAGAFDCAAVRSIAGSVAYVPRAVVLSQLPTFVDHRGRGLTGPVKDQQQVGACAGFAVSSVMDTAIRRMGRGDVAAPLHIFARYSGSDLGKLARVPITAEPVWPYDPARACLFSAPEQSSGCGSYYNVPPGAGRTDPALQGELARADQMGFYRVDAFEHMSTADIDQIVALLADGEAVWAAFDFYRPAWEDASVRSSGYIPDYPSGAGVGHAVALQGYRQGPWGREFLFQNSWGTEWGQGGYAWMPEGMVRSHLLYAYRVRVNQASAPMPIGCAPGSTSILGVCVPPSSGLPQVPAGAWPSGIPSSWPAAVPSSLPACAPGSIPNPFTGQCVQIPSGG